MISVRDLAAWMTTLPADAGIAVDEGGLTLVCLDGTERYYEVGGVPALADWKYEVANGDTKLGYAEWCNHRAEKGVQS